MTPRVRAPGTWSGIRWAMQSPDVGGGVSRSRLVWRAVAATLFHAKAMRRWMTVLAEQQARGLTDDLPGEYLRAVRPSVHRGTDITARVVQLVEHLDWLELAFQPDALERLGNGHPLVLADLPAPRGYEFMHLQLRPAPAASPEGELLLSLTLQRAADMERKAQPVDAAVLAFSRFRVDGTACLVIGGVRGQRNPVLRLSPVEVSQALAGWKPPVLMVRVAQELARYWGLRLIGLDPSAHRLHGWSYQLRKRHREAGQRIYASYDALWEHFEAKKGPPGWMILPLNSDEKLEATALSPEKRSRQTKRADYWIRTRQLLRGQFRQLLMKPGREARLSRHTESMAPETIGAEEEDEWDFGNSEDMVPSRVLETGPGTLQ